jgi:uncharacterized damage-inducible protein DinB
MKLRSGIDVGRAMHTHPRIAIVASLWARFEARDWAGARTLFAGDATLTWHASGERMLDADAIIRVNAIYPEGWSLRVLALNELVDERVHSIVEVNHPPGRFIANSLFGFEGGLIVRVDEYWSTVEAPPAWRTAAAIGAYERFGDVTANVAPPADAPLRDHLATLARYNLWATRKLFEHVDALPEADYRRDAGLFFRSVHGTLNHLLVGEHLLWFRRFAGGESPQVALNAEVEPDRAHLRERLTAGAQAWLPFIAGCDAARLAAPLNYTTTRGIQMSLPFAATLAHVFNHATHHRGQISAAITMMGHPCPEIDLVWMLQSERTSS